MEEMDENTTNKTDTVHNTELSQNQICCKQCESNFKNDADFEEHKRKSCARKFPCGVCGVSFKRSDHLKRHMLSVHSNFNYYTCPLCSENCYRKDSLKKHINIYHLGGPEVLHCPECNFECKTLDELEHHKSTHLVSEWHYCEHCKMPFKRRDHMLRHVKTQHSKMSAQCPLCKQMFKRTDNVSRHIREKHRNKII